MTETEEIIISKTFSVELNPDEKQIKYVGVNGTRVREVLMDILAINFDAGVTDFFIWWNRYNLGNIKRGTVSIEFCTDRYLKPDDVLAAVQLAIEGKDCAPDLIVSKVNTMLLSMRQFH